MMVDRNSSLSLNQFVQAAQGALQVLLLRGWVFPVPQKFIFGLFVYKF